MAPWRRCGGKNMKQQPTLGTLLELPKHVADDFEAFYARYPRRVGKPAARRAWLAATRHHPVAEIMAGLARYQFSSDPKFQPHPSTWLNGNRWKDVEPDLSLDPWGVGEWLSARPSVHGLTAASYGRDAIDQILLAAGWPVTWRGDLEPIDAWLRDGLLPESIASVIAEAVGQFGQRRTLLAFDKRVRFRSQRIDLRPAAE